MTSKERAESYYYYPALSYVRTAILALEEPLETYERINLGICAVRKRQLQQQLSPSSVIFKEQRVRPLQLC